MLLDIKPVRDEAYDCFKGLVASVATWWNREFMFMFANDWGFSLKELTTSDNTFHYRICPYPESDNSNYYLEKYHGLKVELFYVNIYEEILTVIQRELLKNNPVGIFIDSFWCPWNPLFQRYHIAHYCLVIGINAQDNSLVCIDPYLTDDIQILTEDNLKQGYKSYWTFSRVSDPLVAIDLIESLELVITNVLDGAAFQQMNSFANEIETFDILAEKKVYDDVRAVPLVRQMVLISLSRFNVSKLIKYLAEGQNVSELYTISEKLHQEGLNWKKTNTWLIKAFFMEKPQSVLKHIADRIRKAAVDEESILHEIHTLLKDLKTNRQIMPNKSVREAGNKLNTNINTLFNTQVTKTPHKEALLFKGKSLTYLELDRKARQIAYLLRENGVKRDTVVGLITQRSIEMIVGILAIIKAGGAYLPIDPNYPENRINYMLADSQVNILLTEKHLKNNLNFQGTVFCLDDEKLWRDNDADLNTENSPNDLAYVLYTSGSTGNPKGVMIEHHSINNLIQGLTELVDFSPDKTILALTTISFDIFFFETLLPLTQGMTVVIADEKEQLDPRKLIQLMLQHKVDMLQVTPSRLQLLLNSNVPLTSFRNLKEIMVGGEPFPESLLPKLRSLASAKIYNGYGPTETTIYSTIKDLSETDNVNIGKPILNTEIYIVDDHLKIVPDGGIGELCISGEGLARGYLFKPELTAEKFVVHPGDPGRKMYKTGDLARMLPNGEIEYLGRVDFQVKIRGFRIELQEIEQHLAKYPEVLDCIVNTKENNQKERYLIGYYIAGKDIPVSNFISYLGKYLPEYMIPNIYIRLDKFPLTPNGKVDRKALPEPDKERPVLHDKYQEAANETESALVKIWQEVLGRDLVGINDNFFELGGNSLTLVMMHTKLDDLYPNQVDVTDVFAYPSIAQLANLLKEKQALEASLDKEFKFVEFPLDYFHSKSIRDEKIVLVADVEEEIYHKLNNLSATQHIKITRLFLAGYFYVLYNITKQDRLTIYSLLNGNYILPMEINLKDISDITMLIGIMNGETMSDKILYDPINNPLNLQDKVLPIFCAENMAFNIPFRNNELLFQVSDTGKEYRIKVQCSCFNKNKTEELLLQYVKVIYYIGYNF